ncbi:RNA polymerase II transcriptional regulation mediator [Ceraceosorus bombacis]|uniref:Mediator of RNA polymerase II transcription subunit 6 n=1 Tax=Ceraceosorus bombacis TaxID=401625 RepID=A0A0N7L8W0_9BASI|nr:RNA polymerase II transcriptional regulation mediator [Ceraceosorus bombacis]
MALPYNRPNAPAIFFRDPEYLANIGLTRLTALEYFSHSSFFDKRCTNEVLRMQNLARLGANAARRDPKELQIELRKFRGIEFVLAESLDGAESSTGGAVSLNAGPQSGSTASDLFIVHKRLREGSEDSQVKLLQVYFILGGDIMRAPDLYRLVGGRLLSALTSIQSSLKTAYTALPPFDPIRGVSWQLAPPRDETGAESEDSDDDGLRAGGTRRQSGQGSSDISSSPESESSDDEMEERGARDAQDSQVVKQEGREGSSGMIVEAYRGAKEQASGEVARKSSSPPKGGPRRSSRSATAAAQDAESDAMEAEDETSTTASAGIAGRRQSTRSAGKRKR